MGEDTRALTVVEALKSYGEAVRAEAIRQVRGGGIVVPRGGKPWTAQQVSEAIGQAQLAICEVLRTMRLPTINPTFVEGAASGVREATPAEPDKRFVDFLIRRRITQMTKAHLDNGDDGFSKRVTTARGVVNALIAWGEIYHWFDCDADGTNKPPFNLRFPDEQWSAYFPAPAPEK